MIRSPRIGETVIFRLDDQTEYPATVVHEFHDHSLNLVVFTDDEGEPMIQVWSVRYGDQPGNWRHLNVSPYAQTLPSPAMEIDRRGRIVPFYPQETIMTQSTHTPTTPATPPPAPTEHETSKETTVRETSKDKTPPASEPAPKTPQNDKPAPKGAA